MWVHEEEAEVERDVPIQVPMIYRSWRDVGTSWRSRWLRYSLGTEAIHCTLRVGSWTLHVDYNDAKWYPTEVLKRAYRYHYLPDTVLHMGYVSPNIQKPTKGSTWEVVKWKYFNGLQPACCTTEVVKAMKDHGVDIDDYVLTPELTKAIHDRSWILRQS